MNLLQVRLCIDAGYRTLRVMKETQMSSLNIFRIYLDVTRIISQPSFEISSQEENVPAAGIEHHFVT